MLDEGVLSGIDAVGAAAEVRKIAAQVAGK